jgi:metallo-beta-lactamase family protein
MGIRLTFLGAARNVTGSRFLVEAGRSRVLVECGLYQERHLRGRNWEPFAFPPDEIDAVLLTHAHLDHCGLLPKLIREGFRGKVHCTAATGEIAQIILLDSAHIQEEDARFKRKRHEREGRTGPRPVVPLYTTEDAERCRPHFSAVSYGRAVEVAEGMRATFCDAGHVFGSSTISLQVGSDGEARTIVFSGDVGRNDKPILADPDVVDRADYVLVESTYGDRVHEPVEGVQERLARVVNETAEQGGKVLIPSFALERSQELLYHLNELLLAGRIGEIRVFLDSPMAIRITEVFSRHPELFDEEMAERVEDELSPFRFPGLRMTRTVEESKQINRVEGPCIIIAGSGMCTGGRIKHHLARHIEEPQNTVLFVGYQAVGTLGRIILDGAEQVRILGQQRRVAARVERIGGFSAHADRDELCAWLGGLKAPPREVFVVHGEPESAESFREFLERKTGWDVSVPSYEDAVSLD